ncbi:sodium:solute symporter family protein [Compostibacter hankyongensis]|uniref:Na+:solute symporter n=1 Tax=Compostibacter hankyongensis TaxID=1007089 RepID=A0ABP8G9U1_9BACT
MRLSTADTLVISIFFLAMLAIGVWSYFKNKNSTDYFVAGGKMPWWLSGTSHHVSGYSGAVFVAYAGLAYTHGFSVYIWWAFTIGISIIVSARLFPRIWVRLRKKLHIQSPLEYLATRYNLLTQQIMAWSGVLLKLFDVGAKWAAIAILLNVFTGLSVSTGVLISGGISLIYITFGGFWAVILTDFTQFVVQLVGGIVMFVVVLLHMGGISAIWTMWDQLPPGHAKPFNSPYTVWFALAFLCINFLSYNGGTWNLATKYISTKDEVQSARAARVSGILYLIWPLILFFPMWAAPIILPGLENPTESYGLLTLKLLPSGLVGLVLASLFAHTMAMTSSDVNTISAVITRDILPVISRIPRESESRKSLLVARTTTFVFTLLTILVALQYKHFGGVLGLIVTWFGALLGPIAVPMLLGLLPPFKKCGSTAAISAITLGFLAFILTKTVEMSSMALEVGLPLVTSLATYILLGLVRRKKPVPEKVTHFMNLLFEK